MDIPAAPGFKDPSPVGMDIPAAPGFKDAAARSDKGGCFFGILCSSEKGFAFSWYTVEGGCFLACYVVLKKVSLSAATPSKDTEIYIQECDKTETKGRFGTMGKGRKVHIHLCRRNPAHKLSAI
jgi:hypothetical protein